MLLQAIGDRRPTHDFLLGWSTAIIAGAVNVCSVMAFFAFASNVTGHVAVLAEEIVKGHWHQFTFVALWLGSFLAGAFIANFVVVAWTPIGQRTAHAIPLVLEALILILVGWYGAHHYAETLSETEWLVAALLLSMGLQNGLVATVSNGVVKTTHLTGLLTDLGIELALWLNPWIREDRSVHFKLKLHLLILGGYFLGGVAFGALFLVFEFTALTATGFLLLGVLVHDVLSVVESGKSTVAARKAIGSTGNVVDLRKQEKQKISRSSGQD